VTSDRRRPKRTRPSARTLAFYVAGWLAFGACAAAALLVSSGGTAEEQPALPPVRQPELANAVRAGGCKVGRERDTVAASVVPAKPGNYDAPPSVTTLTAALRHGRVVILYRPGLDDDKRDRLHAIQRGVPEGTILTPNPNHMTDDVAIAAYARRLVCPRLTASSMDAVRLFQGRYLGSGPDP
jgi:hypothetical protein